MGSCLEDFPTQIFQAHASTIKNAYPIPLMFTDWIDLWILSQEYTVKFLLM